MTFDECRSQFTETELQKLQEAGQHVIVQTDFFAFNSEVPEPLLEKFDEVFSQWIDRDGKNREDIIRAYLTFLEGLGISVHVENTTAAAGHLTRLIFDENTAQLQVTHKKYSGALSPKKNKYAYIVDIDRQLQFVWDEDGTPRITTAAEAEAVDGLLKRKAIPAKCADTDLLATLAAAVKSAYHYNIGDRITVYLPNFAKALGIRIDRESKEDKSHFDFWGKIKQLENIGGVLVEQGKILRAFVFLDYDQKENTLTFASPYLYSLMDILQKNPARIAPKNLWKNNKPSYEIKGLSYLIDAKIISARSKVTSEVVKCIIAGLMQRGSKPDSTYSPYKQFSNKSLVTYSVTYRDLVKSVPILKEALSESKSDKRSQTLKRAIFGNNYDGIKNTTPIIETYLRTYTDAFNFWKGLEIKVEPVSMKELDNSITLTHYGQDGDFRPRFHIPRPADQVDIEKPD